MRYLSGVEKREALIYLGKAARLALDSSCLRAKCGSLVVSQGKIIGKGFNSPPGNVESQRRCNANKQGLDKKVTDKTCCVHAEQRAIMDALRNHPEKIIGSRLYFIRLNEKDEFERAGKPYCTICSKMALDVGVAEFVLWHKQGVCVYGTEEYNTLSFQFK